LPRERQLVFTLGPELAAARAVEVQLWTAGGELLKREELRFPGGAAREIVQKISLRQGEYLARVFVTGATDAGFRALPGRPLQVADDAVIHVDLAR
jgi:hypothetical protein